jgi:hypothetical protein
VVADILSLSLSVRTSTWNDGELSAALKAEQLAAPRFAVSTTDPAFHRAVETGVFEKLRTGQPLDNEEIQLINQSYRELL